MADDINLILGAALEARGLTTEQSSSLIKAIHAMLNASGYYMTTEQHEEEVRRLEDYIGYYLQVIETYRQRERQCVKGGCVDTQTTEEVLLPDLDAKIYLCKDHRETLKKKDG